MLNNVFLQLPLYQQDAPVTTLTVLGILSALDLYNRVSKHLQRGTT